MSHGALAAQTMAFTNNSRSLTNLGSLASSDSNQAGSGATLSTTFTDSSGVWGSGKNNIWRTGGLGNNGLGSNETTRTNSRSRAATPHAAPSRFEVVEGKTGSGSLVDTSVPSDDWSYRREFARQRNEPANRSLSHAQQPAPSVQQQRSISNAGVPQSWPNANQNVSMTTTKTPFIHTTSSAGRQPSLGSGYSNGLTENGQPPFKVYTKHNEPYGTQSHKQPDSAVSGSWTTAISPTHERNHPFSSQYGSRNASRDPSQPPSRHGVEQTSFGRPDWSQSQPKTASNSSRAPSVSSQTNGGGYGSFNVFNTDQLASRLSNVSLNSDSQLLGSRKPSRPSNGFPSQMTTFSGAGQAPLTSVRNDEVEEIDRSLGGFNGLDGYGLPQKNGFSNFTTSDMPPNSQHTDFRPATSYSNGAISPRGYDVPTGPRSLADWQSFANGSVTLARRSPGALDQQSLLDPAAQMMALRNPYGGLYNPYALQNAIQLGTSSPYLPFLPMDLAGLTPPTGPRDSPIGDGVQSTKLYEFKSSGKNNKRYELKDIYDHIAEFAGDQYGSRFIQTKLETANSDEKQRVFQEIEPNAIPLMTDVFGNYVIQKFFDHGHQDHKRQLANKMRGQVLNLSLQMYGCRVVQKALEHVLVDQQKMLVGELENHVLKCVKDQNGNHVIQKAIERCPSEAIRFVYTAFLGQVQHLSLHPYGCRVIQRCLERQDHFPSRPMIMSELHEGLQSMIADQYGNYVVQHVVEKGGPGDQQHVFQIVIRGLEGYSKHKFASNVVEKCIENANDSWRREVVNVLVSNQRRGEGESVLVGLIKDNFGNYVIQKLLDRLASPDYVFFLEHLHPAMSHAKRTGCGKQVMSIEKKMHRSPYAQHQGPTFQLGLPPTPFASNYGSVANTPPPLTADTQSLQSSNIPNINGDTVEGAASLCRKGSEPSTDGGLMMR